MIQYQKFNSEKIEVRDEIHIYKFNLFQKKYLAYTVRVNRILKMLLVVVVSLSSCESYEDLFFCYLWRKKFTHFDPVVNWMDGKCVPPNKKFMTFQMTNHKWTIWSLPLWFNNIIMHCFGLSERAAWSKRHFKFVYQRLSQLCEERDELYYEVDMWWSN